MIHNRHSSDRNRYYNNDIGFYLEKPEEWVFMPSQWALNIRKRTEYSNDDIALIMQQANTPFVYLQKPLSRQDIAHPTVQATCRYFAQPTTDKISQLARIQIQTFEKNFTDFSLLEQSSQKGLSGFPANYADSDNKCNLEREAS